MDVAASLQEALERIVLHVLAHFREATGQRRLCMAGGVAQNCSMNGKVLTSGLFERVFVQPVAHDAGCALGAALEASRRLLGDRSPAPSEGALTHLYLGSGPEEQEPLATTLASWSSWIECERVTDVHERAADLLARGHVVGWVQGRAEFGPRALGNRSILADPRPAENKDLINAMVKKREAFRPFAPAVLEEAAQEYFEVPEAADRTLPFMIFVVKVREDRRALLGATTHVDGSARVQTVSRQTNERFWMLLRAFGERTGVPVLLNTSFNNNVEPIVDSAQDALACILTTEISHLIVGDYVVTKKPRDPLACLDLVPSVPDYVRLTQRWQRDAAGALVVEHAARTTYDASFAHPLSEALFGLLLRADNRTPLRELLRDAPAMPSAESLAEELWELWSRRLTRLVPRDLVPAAAPP
jgi:carbamoyltransferase